MQKHFIVHVRTIARNGRFNLPKDRKTILRFKQAADEYRIKLADEGGKDITKKTQRLRELLTPFFKDIQLSSISTFDVGRYEKARTEHVMNIEKPWYRIMKAAGLDPKKVVRHTLRHTVITHLVQAGVDLPTVKHISGHKRLSMVEKYSQTLFFIFRPH